MIRPPLVSLLLILLFPAAIFAQGVSCPAVVAGPDTTLNCNDCVRLHATPVSGFTTTTYNVQTIPYNPYPFNAGNSILVAQDDAWGPVVTLPFTFCFYGNSYTQCQAGSNGLLSFTLTAPNSYCPWPISAPIPSPTNPMNCIMAPWHDINPSFGGTVKTQMYGVAPCRVFVVSWENNAMFSCTNVTTTQQIAIYETTNIVEVYIRAKPLCSTWNGGASILGVHNANGTQAVVVPGHNFPTQWSSALEAWRFVPAGAPNYTIAWYQVGNPVPITTLDTITVCPTAVTDYYAQVVYTNCNGATVTVRDTATINASVSSMVLTTASNQINCNGAANGNATVSITGNTGPTTILWSNGGTNATITNLAPGTYTVTVTELGGCQAISSVTITQPTPIVLTPSQTNVACNGQLTGVASVSAVGGTGAFTYLWSNGGNTSSISGLAAGSYTVTVTDANGCQANSTIIITQPPALVLTATSTNVICNGQANGTASVQAVGGVPPLSFLWSNGNISSNMNNLAPGVYTVTVTDNNGCTATSSVTVTEPTVLTSTATSTNVTCFGIANGTATVLPTGGTLPYVYHWSNNQSNATATNLAPGNYSVTVTDLHGCTTVSSVVITQPPLLSIVTTHTDIPCNGQANGTASVTATGGTGAYSYAWSNGANTASVNGLVPGTYTITVTDANGCQATGSVTITEPTLLVASATGTNLICFQGSDGSVSASVVGGTSPYQYNWSNGGVTSSMIALPAGTYTVTVTDAHNCTSVASVTLTEPPLITIDITGDSTLCEYDSLRLTANVTGGLAPYLYWWTSAPVAANDSNQTLVYPVGETRTYNLQVTDQNGCRAYAHREVVAYDAPLISWYPHRQEACDSVTIHFVNLSQPQTCSWNWVFSDNTTSNAFEPNHFFGVGTFSVGLTITTNEGCSSSQYFQDLITVLPTPQASFISDPDLNLVDYILLSQANITFNSTAPWYADSVNWSFGNGDSAFVGQVSYTYQDTGTYCITMNAYNAFGCHTDTTECIFIQQDPFLWVPTGFTPNGDGLNDVFQMGGVELRSFQITIYDRWGKTIFFSDSIENSWTGKAVDEDAPEGVYVFKIDAVNKLNEKISRAGTVTLIR